MRVVRVGKQRNGYRTSCSHMQATTMPPNFTLSMLRMCRIGVSKAYVRWLSTNMGPSYAVVVAGATCCHGIAYVCCRVGDRIEGCIGFPSSQMPLLSPLYRPMRGGQRMQRKDYAQLPFVRQQRWYGRNGGVSRVEQNTKECVVIC